MHKFLIFLFFVFSSSILWAQNKIVKGKVTDANTGKLISFASINAAGYNAGGFTNIEGEFNIEIPIQCDSIVISYIGFIAQKKKASNKYLEIALEKSTKNIKSAVIKVAHGEDRAEAFMKIVVAHKAQNNPERFNSIGYEKYTKEELQIKNLDSNKMYLGKMQAKMMSTFNNLDTENVSKKSLPLSFIEKITDNYVSIKPKYKSEKTIAIKNLGLQTDELIRYLERFNINFNVYNNWIPIFNKTYVSPIADNGTKYYKYYLGDTIIVNGKRQFQIHFEPKASEDNSFKGLMYINDSTFNVRSIWMQIAKNANLNYIKNIRFNELFKEFIAKDGTEVYFPSRDVVDITFESGLDLLGIPTKTKKDAMQLNCVIIKNYDSLNINATQPKESFSNIQNLDRNDTYTKEDSYWESHRLDTLNLHQKSIYKMVDTMKTNLTFNVLTKLVYASSEDFYKTKKINYGPISGMAGYSKYEGIRLLFGGFTNANFNNKFSMGGYVALGLLDKKFKTSATIKYVLPTEKWNKFLLTYKYDYGTSVDNPEDNGENVSYISFLRKKIPYYRMYSKLIKAMYEHQIGRFSIATLAVQHAEYTPRFNFAYFPLDANNQPIYTSTSGILPVTEVNAHISYAKNNKYRVNNFEIYPEITFKPVFTIGATHGLKVLDCKFEYTKVYGIVNQALRLPPKSILRYQIGISQTFGTLPYIMLNIPIGNEFLISSRNGFNTIVPYEFLSDRLITLHTTYNLGGQIFDRLPLLKKMHWRESFSLNSFYGDMSTANIQYNKMHQFIVPNKEPFVEIGAGIENIFHIFSIDYYRRMNYLNESINGFKGSLFLGVKFDY